MGLTWTGSSWSLTAMWVNDPDAIASTAYTAELTLYPITRFAAVVDDRDLLDELCQLWTVYSGRLYTIGEIKALGAHDLDDAGPDSAHTLPWLQAGEYKENHINVQQGLAPAFRLLRAIAGIPSGERTANMSAFVSAWAEVLMSEQAHRKTLVAHTITWADEPWSPVRGTRWGELKSSPLGTSSPSYLDSVIDADLWHLLNIAEALEAYRLDPTLYAWDVEERTALAVALSDGLTLVKSRVRQEDSGLWFFPNAYALHPDYAYAGSQAGSNPFGSPEPSTLVGWDASHFNRVPIFLQGLFECSGTVGEWPGPRAMKELGEFHAAVCWNGSSSAPLQSNFVNGVDGWYRVTSTTGYPPSADAHTQGTAEQRSLFPGNVSGWGSISQHSPGIEAMLAAYIELAGPIGNIAHRERYCFYNSKSWDIDNEPDPLLWILATGVECLSDPPPSSSEGVSFPSSPPFGRTG